MNGYTKIVVLDNEWEAQLLDHILTERGIPHALRSYHDIAYDGLFQMARGWGSLYAPPEYTAEIQSLLAEVRRGIEPSL